MPGWVEHYTSRAESTDAGGARQNVRVFKVWDYARQVIAGNPAAVLNIGGQSLPDYDSQHPDDSTLLLDRYDVTEEGSNGSVARALYSTDRRFRRLGRLDPRSDEFVEWLVSFESREIVIPFAVANYSIVESSGGQSQVVKGWEAREHVVRDAESTMRISYQVVVPRSQALNGIAAIRVQNNKLHTINGGVYRFEAGDARPIDATNWRINYSWLYDAGTPETALPPTDPNAAFPVAVDGFLRKPYHTLIMIHGVGPVGPPDPANPPPPTFINFPLYASDPNGWTSLPGMT